MKRAGARKIAPMRYLPSLPGSEEGGGAARTGGSAVIAPPPLIASLLALLVRRCCGRFELLLDAGDVLGVLHEVLEEAPLALRSGRAEGRRLLVRHVEDNRLRGRDRSLGRLRDRVRVDARRDVLVARAEATLLRPRLGRGRGREEVDEGADRGRVAERDEQVAADLHAARVRAGRDRGP